VYLFEAAHNPEVAGSNPAPATSGGPGNGAFRFESAARLSLLQAVFCFDPMAAEVFVLELQGEDRAPEG